MKEQSLHYAGFWLRFAASLIDTIVLIFIIIPILLLIHGPEHLIYNHQQTVLDLLITNSLPIVGTFLFWKYRAATPGKIFMNLIIVDTATANRPSNHQLLIRYVTYFLSAIPLFIGFFWIGLDKNKQAWHDKMSGTSVLVQKPRDITHFPSASSEKM